MLNLIVALYILGAGWFVIERILRTGVDQQNRPTRAAPVDRQASKR